ncbi:MAG: S8 family serine peptidase, partial [bacterium]
ALVCTLPSCSYDRDPTGLAGRGEGAKSSRGGLVYAEERRAAELARELPGLAGFWYDTSGNVIVSLKSVGDAQAVKSLLRSKFQNELVRSRVRHPGADVLVRDATYTFIELKEWRDRLLTGQILSAPGVVWLDLDEVANRVVIALDGDADDVALRQIAESLSIPPEAVEFELTGPYLSQQTLQDEFRPLEGGIQIQRVSGSNAVTCTLGFTALREDAQVFLTAGHCSPDVMGTDGVEQFQPLAPLTGADSATATAVGREVLRVSEPCGNRRCSYSDAAIYGLIADTIPPIPGEMFTVGRIARPASGCFPGPCNPPVLNLSVSGAYWVVDTTQESFLVNDLVSKIGSATGWSQGLVSRTCVDVSPSNRVTYRCQMFATYGADDGDSGAPILLDIQGEADSTVTLGGIHSGRAGSNRVFSPWSGIVQDYGSLSVTARTQAPSWPLLVDSVPQLDTTRLVQLPSGRYLHRANITLRFKDNVSKSAKVAFFNRHGMTVVGVTQSGQFFVGIPDPGPSLESLFTVLRQLRTEPEILIAASLNFSPLEEVRNFRFPVDGPGQERSDWASSSTGTWAMRAIRAPLAWGCETGTYGGSVPAVGLFEWKHQPDHPEFARSAPDLWEPPDAALAHLPSGSAAAADSNRRHAAATTGLLTAQGNDTSGIAGVMWQTRLHLYAGWTSPGNHPLPIPDNFFVLAQAIVPDRLRLLSLSADVAVDSTQPAAEREAQIQSLAVSIQQDLLDSLPSLLVVVAAGNERYRGSDSAYVAYNRAHVIRAALLLARRNA